MGAQKPRLPPGDASCSQKPEIHHFLPGYSFRPFVVSIPSEYLQSVFIFPF
jgi:hypothetical protein